MDLNQCFADNWDRKNPSDFVKSCAYSKALREDEKNKRQSICNLNLPNSKNTNGPFAASCPPTNARSSNDTTPASPKNSDVFTPNPRNEPSSAEATTPERLTDSMGV